MSDFDPFFQGSDFDWEFDAPHWCDLEKEENPNVDEWFEEQEKKMELESEGNKKKKEKMDNQKQLENEKASNTNILSEKNEKIKNKPKHITRIPKPNSRNREKGHIHSKFVSGSQFTNVQNEDNKTKSILNSTSKFYSKLPVRVPLKEKKNYMKQ